MITVAAWAAIEETTTGGEQVLFPSMLDSFINPDAPPASQTAEGQRWKVEILYGLRSKGPVRETDKRKTQGTIVK